MAGPRSGIFTINLSFSHLLDVPARPVVSNEDAGTLLLLVQLQLSNEAAREVGIPPARGPSGPEWPAAQVTTAGQPIEIYALRAPQTLLTSLSLRNGRSRWLPSRVLMRGSKVPRVAVDRRVLEADPAEAAVAREVGPEK
ncbi:hypothetical protein AYL99_11706 [Fonsecaea erecta]|uniref:Uncharacterized protein n=1 Tax=Fonsecaea erecta TaxID=1367422 RepID=A0A178Z3Q2_9EURO|nr:hypothetical protein AYL99_11706 [Fonsecaea erecta]OAP54171.1 hypothetical protein AYL99_11706 [Fonsecaea erecta]